MQPLTLARRQRMPDSGRAGLTVLELLLSLTILGSILALTLPAISSARESARRVICVDHLRQVGIALHHHHETHRHLPAGWTFDANDVSAYGWAVPLLPYLEQPGLADRIDRDATILASPHAFARQTSLEGMLCPSDITEPTFQLYEADEWEEDEHFGRQSRLLDSVAPPKALVELPTANYVGVFGTIEPDDSIPAPVGDGCFLENHLTRFRDFQRGLSRTLVVGERTMAQVPSTWLGVSLSGEDAAARLVGSTLEGINNPLADECDFSSRHAGGANFLWGDGHVEFMTEQIDLPEYHRLAQLRPRPSHRAPAASHTAP
ncbi:DUF1559 domain-containing protein [Roseiconus nitratireducens]|uniref:DUF1559 domain-containing protein n=1 Tax=Roseiconus nitratireducens TaxID=2605748 RepID=A0A5M6CUK3_9BACT|nr:DUF1559 domain-containing protein [Roseiconus nitratireducens]KAA5538914.1 DUF1559 domain-containing protein [Roseiconus nitratireducens]